MLPPTHHLSLSAIPSPAATHLNSGHLGLEPSSTQLAHLLKEARAAGEFVPHPQLALRYTQLAAERGVKSAAAALSYAYATGEAQDLVCWCVLVCFPAKWWVFPAQWWMSAS